MERRITKISKQNPETPNLIKIEEIQTTIKVVAISKIDRVTINLISGQKILEIKYKKREKEEVITFDNSQDLMLFLERIANYQRPLNENKGKELMKNDN